MTEIFILTLLAALLAAASVAILGAIRGDGYGHRPPPRRLDDDADARSQALARLAR